jgi:hypothetical protein
MLSSWPIENRLALRLAQGGELRLEGLLGARAHGVIEGLVLA